MNVLLVAISVMSAADWLVASVMCHYVVIGWLYMRAQNEPLFLGLYWCYAGANIFLILLAQKMARRSMSTGTMLS